MTDTTTGIDIRGIERQFRKNGADWGKLHEALQAVYQGYNELALPVRVYLGQNLAVLAGQSPQTLHWNLIEWAAQKGALLKLTALLIADQPENPEVEEFLDAHPDYRVAAEALLDRGEIVADSALIRLYDALLRTYTTYGELRRLTQIVLSENLAYIVKGGDGTPLANVVFQLVEWAEAKGRLNRLLAGAVQQEPESPVLRLLGIGVALSAPSPAVAEDIGLQSLVEKEAAISAAGFTDADAWRGRMAQAERAVCRIEDASGEAIGTGFLIAPDLLLTNWHVVSNRATTAAAATPQWRAVFGDGQGGATTVSFADAWRVDDSPVKELDYCVVRLASPAGSEILPDGQPRGVLALSQPPKGWLALRELTGGEPEKDESVLILQHPGGGALKIGVGTITDVDRVHSRISYNATTAPGSSGAPCFTMGWTLLGLHHHGQRQGDHGYAIVAIRKNLRQKGVIL